MGIDALKDRTPEKTPIGADLEIIEEDNQENQVKPDELPPLIQVPVNETTINDVNDLLKSQLEDHDDLITDDLVAQVLNDVKMETEPSKFESVLNSILGGFNFS